MSADNINFFLNFFFAWLAFLKDNLLVNCIGFSFFNGISEIFGLKTVKGTPIFFNINSLFLDEEDRIKSFFPYSKTIYA